MAGNDGRWKKHLLRTSAPLEHEAARILSSQGFGVSADYSYFRLDAGVEKEFSVDVRGVIGSGESDKMFAGCLLDVFVECKYRDRGTTWLFLPHPKYNTKELTDALQAIDVFSPKFVHDQWTNDDPTVPECYSAVEVSAATPEDEKSRGRALESQLKHGVRQLQYALPSLIMLRARMAALVPLEENFPFFIASILLTNAPLVVAHATFSTEMVEMAENLSNVGSEVPCLIWSADVGPDFYSHCQRQFAALGQFVTTPSMTAVEEKRRTAQEASWALPSALARRIAVDPTNAIHIAEFKDVIVVNIAHFSEVLSILHGAFERRATMLKDYPLVKW